MTTEIVLTRSIVGTDNRSTESRQTESRQVVNDSINVTLLSIVRCILSDTYDPRPLRKEVCGAISGLEINPPSGSEIQYQVEPPWDSADLSIYGSRTRPISKKWAKFLLIWSNDNIAEFELNLTVSRGPGQPAEE